MSSQHWTLDTAKEKLDPAELQMLETHYKIEGQKEAVGFVLDTIVTLLSFESSFEYTDLGVDPAYIEGLNNLKKEVEKKYSHLFKEAVNVR